MVEAGFVGADPQMMKNVGDSFTTASGDLSTILTTLKTQVGNISWTGGAANTFKEAWETDYVTKLQSLVDLLAQTGPKIVEKAGEINDILNPGKPLI
jgi:hypothetical protein